MNSARQELYNQLEEMLNTKIICFITSDRRGAEAQIAADVIDIFIDQLDKIGATRKLSLFLYTRGGDTAAAWNIVNLIRMFCDEFQVIIPHKAHSAGTLISIGANEIMMTKQATLGPIDPSLNTPLNPIVPGANSNKTQPVSVEAVKGFLAFAKEELAIKDDKALADIMIKLSDTVHPLVLGQVYRIRAQIKMLANKLLVNQVTKQSKINQIINFLCSDSGSHDYTINRREAKDILGLNIIKPTDEQYQSIKSLYDDLADEFCFGTALDLKKEALGNGGEYKIKHGLVESLSGGSYYFISEGRITNTILNGQQRLNIQKEFEGWRYVNDGDDEPNT